MERDLLDEFFAFRQYCFQVTRRNDVRNGNECHFVGFMRRGQGRLIFDGGELSLSEGELFYIPMGYRYHSFWEGNPEVCLDSYGFTYFPRPSVAAYPLQIIPLTPEIRESLEALAEHRSVDCRSIGRLYLLLRLYIPHRQIFSRWLTGP